MYKYKMDNYDTDIETGDDAGFEQDHRPSATFLQLDKAQYHISLQDLGDKLQKATNYTQYISKTIIGCAMPQSLFSCCV